MKSKLFPAVATLTGTVIGAGFLAIPYVIAKSGFFIGLVHMTVICFMMMMVNLMAGEISLSTRTIHHLPGYASKYLGKKTKIFVFIASIIGLYAALVAYIIGEGESLSFILFNTTKFSLTIGIIFWLLMSVLTLGGIKRFKKIEPIGVLAVFITALIFGIININKINTANLTYSNPEFMFLPFGVVLFAFLGITSIPEIKRVLKNNEKIMKGAIVIGSLIPLAVYVLFTIIVLGLHGQGVQEIATISLGKIITLLGILTMFTAFLALSLALQDTYRFDFELNFKFAWLLSVCIPLILFIIIKIFNLAGFVKILSIGGAVSGGLLSIAILFIHEHLQGMKKKTERKPEFFIRVPLLVKVLFVVLFLVGIVYEFL